MADQLSQSDLNALLGLDPDDDASKQTETEASSGLSQGDLDSLLAGLGETPAPPTNKLKNAPPPVQEVSAGDSLSQDEIDRLLADFGK